MKKKIGVVLSGCGVYDGTEIHESVITLLAIDRAGAEAVCMAPNVDQMHVSESSYRGRGLQEKSEMFWSRPHVSPVAI